MAFFFTISQFTSDSLNNVGCLIMPREMGEAMINFRKRRVLVSISLKIFISLLNQGQIKSINKQETF